LPTFSQCQAKPNGCFFCNHTTKICKKGRGGRKNKVAKKKRKRKMKRKKKNGIEKRLGRGGG
jgi:hypothetical protein